jgi:hypothetical protein
LIDRGNTPLPVFGYDDEPTAILTAYGYCLVDGDDERARIQGFSTMCAGTIAFTKVIVVGISLGTGICGGHFWAPLFVGCAASHFFTDIMAMFSEYIGYGHDLSSYPCLAVLCIMGSTHVVTFRAQLAIILVLTLSIGSFSTQEKLFTAEGDYSAIFPLLVVACFVPLLLTRNCTFYAKQCCRGDITAIPEVLCEPFKQGTAEVFRIDGMDEFSDYGSSVQDDDDEDDDLSVDDSSDSDSDGISLEADEKYDKSRTANTPRTEDTSIPSPEKVQNSQRAYSEPPLSLNSSQHSSQLNIDTRSGHDQLSSSMHSLKSTRSNSSRRSRSNSNGGRPSTLTRVRSIGKIDDSNYQKPLLYQSRDGASTAVKKNTSRSNTPVNTSVKPPRTHKRTKSGASFVSVNNSLSPSKAEFDAMDQSRH